MGVTQSQILSVTPARMPEPPTPPRRRRPSELSLWGGNVLAADDFAPDAKRGAWRGGRVALVVIVAALLAAGGWVWHSWPNLPWVGQFAFAPKPAQPIVTAPAQCRRARPGTPCAWPRPPPPGRSARWRRSSAAAIC